MRKKYDILYLPLHRTIEVVGSEIYWALNAFRSVSNIYHVKAYVGSLSVTAYEQLGELSDKVESYSIGVDRTVVNDIRFYFSLLITGIKESFSARIIHHYGAFGFMKGFNPAFLLPKLGRKFIIGPILYPNRTYPDSSKIWVELGFIKRQHNYGRLMNVIFKVLHMLTLIRSDLIIFDCDATRRIYLDEFPFLERKEFVIIPGGGASETDFHKETHQLRSENLVLGVASNLIKSKNIDRLLEALALSDNSISLKIAGEGPEMHNLISLSRKLSLEKQVTFLGRIDHSSIANFYNSIDIYAALYDAPTEVKASVQEAMMCGCAIISGESGTLDPIIKKDWGFIVNLQSVESIAAAINTLFKDRSTLEEMKAQAQKFAHQHFSSAAVLDKMKQLYGRMGVSERVRQ